MLIPRREALPSTGMAAFLPRATRRVASRSEMSLAYLRLGVHREAALGQTAERADEVGRHPADEACTHEDGVDVPVGMVVGEDRPAQIVRRTGGLEVPRGREDRVDRVVRILLRVAVGIDAVQLPRGRDELHPAHCTGARHVQVAAVVRLDLVDRGEHLPRHAVLDPRCLVDRQQEHGDAELVDEEARNANLHGARECQREGRVLWRRNAVGEAKVGLLRASTLHLRDHLVDDVAGRVERSLAGAWHALDLAGRRLSEGLGPARRCER